MVTVDVFDQKEITMKSIVKFIVAIVFVVASSAAAVVQAQSQRMAVALPMVWGTAEVWEWVDADGNPATTEVVVRNYDDYKYKVVRIQQNGAWCEGPWFWWGNDSFAFPQLKKFGTKDIAYVTHWLGLGAVYVEYNIDVPNYCTP